MELLVRMHLLTNACKITDQLMTLAAGIASQKAGFECLPSLPVSEVAIVEVAEGRTTINWKMMH